MIGMILVHTIDGGRHAGVRYEMTDDSVRDTVQKVLEAEGQGSFVIETTTGWRIFPTRSILLVEIVKQAEQSNSPGDSNDE